MAPKQKRPSPLNDPPPIESEEEKEPSNEQEEEDDDDEDDGNEEGETASSDEQEGDDEQEKYRLLRSVQPAPRNPSSSKPRSSSSDSESATESDSDSEPETPAPTPNSKVKPLASKPKEQVPKVKQPQSASKRPAENNVRSRDQKQVKKKKVEAEVAPVSDDEDSKKSSRDDSKKLFQRLFSEEDEISVLEGMVEFRSATGGDDPYKCPDAFHDFMMKRSKRISFDASSGQLKEKIRRLKTKFNNNARRGKNGEAPRFSKPHEQRAFELSQAIWGEGAGGGGGVNNGALEKAKRDDGKAGKKITNLKKEIISENEEKLKLKPEAAKAKLDSELQPPPADSMELGKVDERTEKSAGLGSMVRYDKGLGEYGLGEDFLRKGDGLMEASKRAEFEGKWTKLEAAELELRVKRAELYANHAKSMLQAIKSSKN